MLEKFAIIKADEEVVRCTLVDLKCNKWERRKGSNKEQDNLLGGAEPSKDVGVSCASCCIPARFGRVYSAVWLCFCFRFLQQRLITFSKAFSKYLKKKPLTFCCQRSNNAETIEMKNMNLSRIYNAGN